MSETTDKLYTLLPAIYRIRDQEHGEPLRALMAILESQYRVVEDDVVGLYDDWFIETAAEWVIPYVADLLGVRMMHTVESTGVFSQRAFVANTLRYRRRKGTLAMLEGLASDVTGWGAHAVAFFENLQWSQHLNHLRYDFAPNPYPRSPDRLNPAAADRVGTVNLRSLDVVDRLNGPFDAIAHTVDIRPIGQREGWHNIRNIGFFLWRLQSYPLRGIAPRVSAAGQHAFHFSPLGAPTPLFNNPDRKEDEIGFVTEVNVPDPIRPVAFFERPEAYYDHEADRSLAVYEGPEVDPATLVPPEEVFCKDLSDWSPPPLPYRVAVDVVRGRLAYRPGEAPDAVTVTYHYGFSGDLGGGPYDRRGTIVKPDDTDWVVLVSKIEPPAPHGEWRDSIRAALDDWNPAERPRAVVTLLDHGSYDEVITLNLEDGQQVVIQAANEQRPHVRFVNAGGALAALQVTGGTGAEAALTLSGLLVEGHLAIDAGSLGRLDLVHCTLEPGRALGEDGAPHFPGAVSLDVADPNDDLEISIEHCITGALRLPENLTCLSVRDSILDAAAPDTRAVLRPALLSGNLSPFPALSAATPSLEVSIGNAGPYLVTLSPAPTTLAEARDALQVAIRGASADDAFAEVQVITTGNRLVVLPSIDAEVHIAAATGDATAEELRLDAASSEERYALVSGALDPFPTLAAPTPHLMVTLGTEGPHTAELASVPTTLAQGRDALQAALRDAHTSSAFTSAVVISTDDRLVVLPGTAGAGVALGRTADDATTAAELALAAGRPALAHGLTPDEPGPPTVLERVTVFGEVFVKTLSLASEVLFTGRVHALRRQAGCVRFSYVREGSRTPRRFRCQPDLALEAQAKERGTTVALLPLVEAAQIRVRLRPDFTSERYGTPGYAQLGLLADDALRTGAEDGAEMGAFNHLKQAQREANLRLRLEEYLPFGLKAGLLFVT